MAKSKPKPAKKGGYRWGPGPEDTTPGYRDAQSPPRRNKTGPVGKIMRPTAGKKKAGRPPGRGSGNPGESPSGPHRIRPGYPAPAGKPSDGSVTYGGGLPIPAPKPKEGGGFGNPSGTGGFGKIMDRGRVAASKPKPPVRKAR